MGKRIDLTGQVFGKLKVIEYARVRSGRHEWRCLCNCGKEKTIRGSSLTSGNTKSCGCLVNRPCPLGAGFPERDSMKTPSKRRIDLTGKKFGRLTVLGEDGYKSPGKLLWMCRCECGQMVSPLSISLRNGNTKSCGCLSRETKVDFSGQRFGKLKVVTRAGKTASGQAQWSCICDCGNVITKSSQVLLYNSSASCGCNHKKTTTKHQLTRKIQESGLTLKQAAVIAQCSENFLWRVSSGESGVKRKYFGMRKVWGESTPDTRKSKSVFCAACGSIIKRERARLKRNKNNFCCRECFTNWQRGERPKPFAIPDLRDPRNIERPKERKPKAETVAIQEIVNESMAKQRE